MAVKKATGKRAPAKKATTTRAAAKKAPARTAPAKKTPARATPAKQAAAKRAPAKRAPAKKAAARKVTAQRAGTRKAPVRKAPARRAPARKAAARPEVTEVEEYEEYDGADEVEALEGDPVEEPPDEDFLDEEPSDASEGWDDGGEATALYDPVDADVAEDGDSVGGVEDADGTGSEADPEAAAWARLATDGGGPPPAPPSRDRKGKRAKEPEASAPPAEAEHAGEGGPKEPTGAGLVVLSLVALLLCPFLLLPLIALVAANNEARRHRRRARAARAIATLALALGIAADIGGGVVLLTGGDSGVAYTSFKVGQCFDYPPENFTSAKVVACTGPHNLEVFSTAVVPVPKGTAYPGSDALVQYAGVACTPDFTSYVGVAPDQSTLPQVEIVPQKSAWDDGNRKLVCAIGNAEAKTSGSVKDSRR